MVHSSKDVELIPSSEDGSSSIQRLVLYTSYLHHLTKSHFDTKEQRDYNLNRRKDWSFFFAKQVNWPSPAVFSFQTNGKWFRAVSVNVLDPQS